MEFFRQEYWSGLPFPSSGDLLRPGIEPGSPALQVDSLLKTSPPILRDKTIYIQNYVLLTNLLITLSLNIDWSEPPNHGKDGMKSTLKKGYRSAVPKFFGSRDRFHGRQFIHGLGTGWEWFQDDSHKECATWLPIMCSSQ